MARVPRPPPPAFHSRGGIIYALLPPPTNVSRLSADSFQREESRSLSTDFFPLLFIPSFLMVLHSGIFLFLYSDPTRFEGKSSTSLFLQMRQRLNPANVLLSLLRGGMATVH